MKNKIFSLLFTLVANIGTIFASDTLVDGIWYDFYSSSKTAVVTFRGTYAGAYSNEYTGVVNIPSLVTYNNETYTVSGIGDYAFEYCSGLTSVITPNSLTSIGAWAFSNCANLRSIGIPNSVTRIGAGAFNNCPGLTSITIPDGVMSIEQMVFSDCSGLTNVEMPNSIISIGDDAFTGCSGLTSVIIPNGVTSIGQSAFFGCDGLTSIEIPNSVTSIGHHAFSLCSSLVSITIHNKVPPIYGTEAMPDYNRLKIYVPCVSVNDYKTAWSSQASRIHANPNYEYVFECQVSPANVGVVEMPINTCADTIITAVPNYGYHFVKWSDSITDNPRSIELTQDTSFTAILARNPRIRYYYDSEMGSINGDTTLASTAEGGVTFTAVPKYGYHFTKWSDGVTDNPRTIYLTKDTSFTAEFAKNVFTLTYFSDLTMGDVQGGLPQAEYLDTITFEAIPNYGYHFVRWNDNNTSNPRSVVVTQNNSFQAVFAKNIYNIVKNVQNGNIVGLSQANYLDNITLTVTSIYGYRFTHWSDGVTDNPRVFVLTQDTAFTAVIKKNPIVQYNYDSNRGHIIGDTTLANSATGYVTFNAIPNYGYHFNRWSDGIKDNPRTIYLTQDTAFTAEFGCNTYTITTESSNVNWGMTAGDTTTSYLDTITISATPYYGYHFTGWNDGDTISSRKVIVTEDKTYQAIFAKKTYTIEKSATNGTVSGMSQAYYLDSVTLTVIPNYGYHFTQWSDSVTENPRTFVLTCDTAFTAEFATNMYSMTTLSSNPEWGFTKGDTIVPYLTKVEIEAIANYGYHFVQWSDGKFNNPRSMYLNQDTTFTAIFEKNTYTITKLASLSMGTIEGASQAEYLDSVELNVVAIYGYHFKQWSDSVTDNPRIFVLTQDTSFIALFDFDTIGSCGDNLALLWEYNDTTKTLTISGEGALNSNYTFGLVAPTEMEKLILSKGVASIGNSAFANYSTLQEVSIPTTVTVIYEKAFYNCTGLTHIYNYREQPCVAYSNTFDGLDKFNCTLHVPANSIDLYKSASVWRDFYNIEGIETPEGFENIDAGEKVQKILLNGTFYILRGDRVYTLQGQEVK